MPEGLSVPPPSNLSYQGGKGKLTMVEGDVYSICTRIKEIDPRLSVVLHEGHAQPWVVMEKGEDGVERFVKRYEELDARILEDLRYMLKVPFDVRIKKLDAEIAKANEGHGQMSEEAFEKFAHQFMKAGIESNILNPKWRKNM